jgi:hypothetical protein
MLKIQNLEIHFFFVGSQHNVLLHQPQNSFAENHYILPDWCEQIVM